MRGRWPTASSPSEKRINRPGVWPVRAGKAISRDAWTAFVGEFTIPRAKRSSTGISLSPSRNKCEKYVSPRRDGRVNTGTLPPVATGCIWSKCKTYPPSGPASRTQRPRPGVASLVSRPGIARVRRQGHSVVAADKPLAGPFDSQGQAGSRQPARGRRLAAKAVAGFHMNLE